MSGTLPTAQQPLAEYSGSMRDALCLSTGAYHSPGWGTLKTQLAHLKSLFMIIYTISGFISLIYLNKCRIILEPSQVL